MDEVQYSSDIGSNKRKYDEQEAPPPPRRPTGFSAPISPASPDDQAAISYNSGPPPSSDDVDAQVQNAKQRAQEIASRLLYNAGIGAGTGAGVGGYEAKRVRVDNGGGFDSPIQDKTPITYAPSAIPAYNYPQNSSKKIDVPNGRVGVIIGKSGETIKSLQLQSGAKIQVTRDMDADRTSLTRPVELMGTPDQIARAEQLINDVLAEAEAGGTGVASRRTSSQLGSDQFVMSIPNNKVGLVIGKGGETIKSMQARTGARIQVVPLHPPPGDTSTERSVHIDGTPEQIEAAKELVNEAISENRMRNSSMGGGGYNQQPGYQARPQTNWGAAPQMQQAGGYGYAQTGAYPGAPQYASQAQYGGYPSQTAAAGGGYGANWDQSSAAQQQGSSGGYDYYGQQQQQQAPSQQQPQNPSGQDDESGGGGYNYNNASQAPAASSYSQQGSYGYGGYGAQTGYYDQQQGGYGSAAGYGATQDGSGYGVGQGGDSTSASAAGYNNSSGGQGAAGYGVPPATSQGAYGPPSTTQKPLAYGSAAYGQSQQSPTAAPGSGGGGYGQAPPPGASYPHSHAPSTGGYAGAPAYGGPPPPAAPQSGYGQQVSAYGVGYGNSGYPQPPASYYGDASATSAAPAPQASAAAPKASPKK